MVMLPDLKELYIRKSSLLSELENVEQQISYLEQPENLTQERMKMLEKNAMKRHNISKVKTILTLFTTLIAVVNLMKVLISK